MDTPTDEKPKTETPASVSSIASDLTGEMPEPSPNADRVQQSIAERQGKQEAGQKKSGRGRPGKSRADVEQELRELGESPDPSRTDAQLKRDLANAKKRARRASGETPTKSTVRGVPQSDEEAERRQKYFEVGETLAGAFFGAMSNIDEDEWQPTEGEEKSIRRGFCKVAEHYEWGDLHPVLSLTVAIVFYALPRIKKPKTREKLGPFAKWLGRRLKK